MPAASLRVRLALWLALPLAALVAACGWLAWRHAGAVADYVQDHDLLASAKVLSDRLIWEGDDVHASVPPSALSLFASPGRDRVFLSVTGAGGELLAGTPGFPLPAQPRLSGGDLAQWYDADFGGEKLRAVVTRRSMYGVAGSRDITIAVGKTTRSRDGMRLTLWWPTMAFLGLALVLALLLTLSALTWELRPLARLRAQLAGRDPLHFDLRVDTRVLHSELRPIVETINRFAQQLDAHSAAQRRFIADAAHQLRTPLALQASQIEYARHHRRNPAGGLAMPTGEDAIWLEMQTSNRRLVAVTNKLLLLAQAEHADAVQSREPVVLAEHALRSVEQLAGLADRRRIDLGLDVAVTAAALTVDAQPALLDALIANLLDNALRYTQEGGRVTVTLRGVDGGAELAVEDNGPGIPAEARERVFERFFRLAHGGEGTGLGLAIVREIVRAFGARMELATPAEGHGLRAVVRFKTRARDAGC